jgi:hypothetical protein
VFVRGIEGQLGLGDKTYQLAFRKVPLEERAIDISSGFQHSLILTCKFSWMMITSKSPEEFMQQADAIIFSITQRSREI